MEHVSQTEQVLKILKPRIFLDLVKILEQVFPKLNMPPHELEELEELEQVWNSIKTFCFLSVVFREIPRFKLRRFVFCQFYRNFGLVKFL